MGRMATLVRKAFAMAVSKATMLTFLLAANSMLLAADADAPEMEFLEYLGLWEASDEDWLLLSEEISTQVVADDTRIDSELEGDESAENDDES